MFEKNDNNRKFIFSCVILSVGVLNFVAIFCSLEHILAPKFRQNSHVTTQKS